MKKLGEYSARKLWNATPDPLHYVVYGRYPFRMHFWRSVLKVAVWGRKLRST